MKLHKVLQNDCWIIEDVYYGWVSESFEKADIIIVLETNVIIKDWRIIKRFLIRKIGLAPCNKRETIKGLIDLIKWNHDYDKRHMIEAEQMINKLTNKKVIISNNKGFNKFLKQLA